MTIRNTTPWLGGNREEALQHAMCSTHTLLVGGRFVFVGGLGERYTNALINGIPLPSPEPDRTHALRLEYGTTAAGEATEAWIRILRRRLPSEEAARFAGMRRVLSSDEQAWAGTIEAKLPAWEREIVGVVADVRSEDDRPTVWLVEQGMGSVAREQAVGYATRKDSVKVHSGAAPKKLV